jgi:small-conductance mechanosensitive channel
MFARLLPNLKIYFLPCAVLCLLLSLGYVNAAAQQPGLTNTSQSDDEITSEIPTAPVVVDANRLFSVRGISAFPAEQRAEQIAERIRSVARDRQFSTQNLRLAQTQYGTQILAGNQPILTVFDDDARVENAPRQIVAEVYLRRISESIDAFRRDRQPKTLLRNTIYSIVAALLFIIGLFVGVKLVGRIRASLERRYKAKIHGVEIQAVQVIHARHIWKLLLGTLAFVGMAIVFIWAYATLYFILSLFPWTRGLSRDLFWVFLNPVRMIVDSFVSRIPDLIFLIVLGVVSYYVLKLIRLVFSAIEKGTITISGFYSEWAKPTYRLARILVIAFVLVIAFPYIPGSNTQAFKGLSIFIGLIVSLGSTSLIGNLISGYSLTYRRVFKQGDRVKIGEHIGYVERSSLMVTYLHSIKNEVIAVPNSQIINTEVINYSSMARTSGLILHTEVGIGYETPWRQVEAMLIAAAARTAGLLREPKPFVLQKALGDFAVTYEINVYCDSDKAIEELYTLLHQNILDVFNEYGVQIMTPAYVRDPEQAKIVPRDQWYAAPASAESGTVGNDFDRKADVHRSPEATESANRESATSRPSSSIPSNRKPRSSR